MKKNSIVLIIAGLALVGAAALLGGNRPGNDPKSDSGQKIIAFEKDQTFTEDYSVAADEKLVVKNGVKLTFEKNLTVSGLVTCENGPLNLTVKGSLKIDRYVQCNIGDKLKEGDAGNGIVIAAKTVEVGEDAFVVSNGNVQLAGDESKLATTAEAVNKIYDEAGQLTREGKFIGPFWPFDQMPKDVLGRPTSQNIIAPYDSSKKTSYVASESSRGASGGALPLFIAAAKAAVMERATDIEGNEVANTIRIGGTWVVGSNPPGLVPEELKIPTPPAGIKKIILNFDFGGEDVNIGSFTLFGPDGRPGTNGELNCDSRGGKGESAMRLNVNASGITIGNFEIHLGAGGNGGNAGSSTDCDHGKATGGDGGESGNIKMTADKSIAIEGSMNIFPGAGGVGGDAFAYGKDGKDGCGGENGGDATAKGGNGADNKKGLMVAGAVSGKENVTIHDIFGGSGGLANARAGKGGNGTGPKCAGGTGGKAIAIGGKGGSAQSVKAASIGGNGGFVSSNAGKGGNGGNGSATEAGGNGGTGGNATATPGDGGQGTSSNGAPGVKVAEQGGDGGNGGNGCGPGNGGNAGSGTLNPGVPGIKGQNLCVVTEEEENKTTGEVSRVDPIFNISGPLLFAHTIGTTSCPQNIGTVSVTGSNIPAGASIRIEKPTIPSWMSAVTEGSGMSANVKFNCQLERYETQGLSSDLKVTVVDVTGKTLKDFSVKVTGSIKQ